MNAQQDRRKWLRRKLDAAVRVSKHLALSLLNGTLAAGGAALGALDEGVSLTNTYFITFASVGFALVFILSFVGYEVYGDEEASTLVTKPEEPADAKTQAPEGGPAEVPLCLVASGNDDGNLMDSVQEVTSSATTGATQHALNALDWMKEVAADGIEALEDVLADLKD